MSFQDTVYAKLQHLEEVIQFVKGWVINTKSPEWVLVDPGYVVAMQQYRKMRQRIIDEAALLPTV